MEQTIKQREKQIEKKLIVFKKELKNYIKNISKLKLKSKNSFNFYRVSLFDSGILYITNSYINKLKKFMIFPMLCDHCHKEFIKEEWLIKSTKEILCDDCLINK
jgi:hypothetical protein